MVKNLPQRYRIINKLHKCYSKKGVVFRFLPIFAEETINTKNLSKYEKNHVFGNGCCSQSLRL